LNQIFKRQTSPFHYGSKFPAIIITVFITNESFQRGGSLTSEFDIETSSGTGHSSSENVADLPSQNAGRS
jgi:hypothetical protein